ncbi:MAG: hypothetical protein HDS03_05860 [Bacteroides sp.]|nr:hypothetical protein [Bacteroides sp.]MBD5329393.1 hypothetical protein [Bacteroides sp.]
MHTTDTEDTQGIREVRSGGRTGGYERSDREDALRDTRGQIGRTHRLTREVRSGGRTGVRPYGVK